jgi:hypothetical protein
LSGRHYITDFINSKDIRDYHREIGYKYNALEAAHLFSVLYRNGANYQQTIVFCLSLDYNVIRKITLIMMEHKNEKGLSQHESAERCTLPVPRYPDGSQATAMGFNCSSLLVKFPQS